MVDCWTMGVRRASPEGRGDGASIGSFGETTKLTCLEREGKPAETMAEITEGGEEKTYPWCEHPQWPPELWLEVEREAGEEPSHASFCDLSLGPCPHR